MFYNDLRIEDPKFFKILTFLDKPWYNEKNYKNKLGKLHYVNFLNHTS